MQKQLIFGTIKSLHDLFTALWIGGLLTTAITFMPALKRLSENPIMTRKMMKIYHHRLRTIALISIVGLWITGLLLTRQSPASAGFLNFSTRYHVLLSTKHLTIFGMVMIALYRGFILGRKIEKFSEKEQKIYSILLFVNTFLGVIVVFLSGISAVFGKM